MRPPYKLAPTPEGNVNAGTRVLAAPIGQVFEHAKEDGETLSEAGIELGAPDHEVGSGAPTEGGMNRGEDHLQRPVYGDAIPWPAAVAVDHKPMKLKG